ncbi:hypothetical protein K443DRAFT_671610 [Laccaria amethystina LaAM-08-1]|uniref:Uncharacterized protein n=1 Tax=Laccaria amethystina LaAM-08-1 TaxID=1095629 RepID=A0A0C9Y593_9AGAR|nr:hypothetical protein K443DRAFT_671610 [Laccaria amethystina LaAM-08-1]
MILSETSNTVEILYRPQMLATCLRRHLMLSAHARIDNDMGNVPGAQAKEST